MTPSAGVPCPRNARRGAQPALNNETPPGPGRRFIRPTVKESIMQEGTEPRPTATLVRQLSNFRGDARLYRLTPPLDDHEFVVVSAADVPYSGPETYIFAADTDGEVTSWSELPGSFRGGSDHEAALEGAGYEVSA